MLEFINSRLSEGYYEDELGLLHQIQLDIKEINDACKIDSISVTTPEAAIAQEYLVNLPDRYLDFAVKRKDRAAKRGGLEIDVAKFGWLK